MVGAMNTSVPRSHSGVATFELKSEDDHSDGGPEKHRGATRRWGWPADGRDRPLALVPSIVH